MLKLQKTVAYRMPDTPLHTLASEPAVVEAAVSPPTAIPYISMMGCRIHNLSMTETLQAVERFVASRMPHQHVVVNVDKVVKADRDPELRSVINACDLINADGMPIVWASRLLGKPLKERVTGIDLFDQLMGRAAVRGWRVYLLGAEQVVVDAVRDVYSRRHPEIQIVGCRNGYWSSDEERTVAENVAAAKPDILFVAISSPKKERFLNVYQPLMRVPFAMGVGGSFDVVTGRTKRAPVWMQKSGLEWFHRFLQEPRRMFKRYFIDDFAFLRLFMRELLRR